MKMIMMVIKVMDEAIIVDEIVIDMVHIILEIMLGFEMNLKIRIKILGIRNMNLEVFVTDVGVWIILSIDVEH